MVDPVGTAIGVVGLFSTCLEGWHLVEDGRSMSSEFVIQRQRYLNLRLRFVLWGEACGLDIYNHFDDGNIPQSIRLNVLDTLGCIAKLFDDGDKLNNRYGLDTGTNSRDHQRTSSPTETSHLQALTDQHNRFEQRMKRVKGHAGRIGSVRWAISDKSRFMTLINHLGQLVGDLETLTLGTGARQKQRQLARREINAIDDLSELQIIQEASLRDDDPISDAATARISNLRTQPSEASKSSYYTAGSDSSGDESATIEAFQSVPEIMAHSQWQRILASLPKGTPFSQQNILVDESKSGDLLLWMKATHLLSALPEKAPVRRSREIRQMASAIVPWIDGWPIGDDFQDFIAAIEGPLGTPYEGSVFYLRITFSTHHPYRPPDCRFLTKIYHPNINSFGHICSDLFNSGWAPSFTLTTVLVSISGLLTTPNIEDPLVPEIATIYVQEPQTYEQYARVHALKHANPRLHPRVDEDGMITFQICDTSLAEVVYCLENRAVDDALMLEKKYKCQRLEFYRKQKVVDDPIKLQAECQICDDIITISQKAATVFRPVDLDALHEDLLPKCFLLLKHSLVWLEDLLLNRHEAQKQHDQPGQRPHGASENTAWLIWSLGAIMIKFKKILASHASD